MALVAEDAIDYSGYTDVLKHAILKTKIVKGLPISSAEITHVLVGGPGETAFHIDYVG